MKTMKKGFTLIELIVVIAIIAILALILVPQVTGYIDNANDARGNANAKACYTTALANWTSVQAGVVGTVTADSGCNAQGTGNDMDGNGDDAPTGATWTEPGDGGDTYTYTPDSSN